MSSSDAELCGAMKSDSSCLPVTTAYQAARVQIAEELREDLACLPSDNLRLTEQYRRQVMTKQESPELDLPPATNRDGSPYRNATFDLVKNFTLYQSLISTTRRLSPNADSKWLDSILDKFEQDLLRPHNGERQVADRVVGSMFHAVPSVRERGAFFDPISIAEEVLVGRANCANEWLKVVDEVREEHLDLEKRVLETEL